MRGNEKKISTVVYASMFLAASVIISIVESVSGINNVLPFPGVKLGLCNTAVTACLYICGVKAAACVAFLRPFFLFLFFSNPMSFAMSAAGGILSFCSLLFTRKLYRKAFSFCGISCISAVFHSTGQIIAAALLTSSPALFFYLPLFVASSSIVGTVCGIVMNLVIPILEKAKRRGY